MSPHPANDQAPLMPVSPNSKLTLVCILVTIFLDMLGYGIVLPVLPRLIGELTGGTNAEAAVLGGYLVFSYSLMQFLFGPALGNLSDRFGRRPIILIALTGLTINYTIMGFSPNVAWLFVGQTIAGISGASVATATAYIADITPKEQRAQRFGLIGAAIGLGFIAGPVVGGLLGSFGPRVPFYAAAGLAASALTFGFFVLPESLRKELRRPFRVKRANPFGALWALSRNPVVLWLLSALLMFTLAAQAFPTAWPFFTIEVLNFSSQQIGFALGAFGLGFALSQAVFIAPSIKKFGEPATVLIGMAFAVVAFTGTALIHSELPLYLFLLIGSMAGLAGPAINSLMSHQVPDDAQGELQGAINATNSLAAILGPLMATQLFNAFSKGQEGNPYFPGAPFIGSAVMVLIAAAVFGYAVWRFDLIRRPRVSKKEHQHEMGQPGQQQTAPHDENLNGG
jgi:MFS transporter, DHA1 family, tetracycline resistance protein